MKSYLILTSLLLFSTVLFAQTIVEGVIIDAKTKDPLAFSNVSLGTNGVISDLDGKYSIEVPNGKLQITFSYVGYENVVKEVDANGGTLVLDVEMGANITLVEIVVEDDIATDRKTPVAFTNIPTKKILEEISGEDIASVINTVPGAQYTQQGGGDGDARISIRGFSQRNVAVMIDGIPVNDMENGWVYWSNWFGLDVATKTVQVQRGLGAAKLSIPSVGGTMNIITKGIQSKKEIMVKQQIGNNGFLQTTVGLTSGRLKGGWGVTLAGSYKQGNGWVDQNYTQGGFYYAKIDKQFGKHIITATAMGAPQNHGQRSYKAPVSIIDATYAQDKLNMSEEMTYAQAEGFFLNSQLPAADREKFPLSTYEQGLRYNRHWGSYTNMEGEATTINTTRNYYHKPQFSLRHTWDISDKLYLSNVLYASIGNGGGTGTDGTILIKNRVNQLEDEDFGQLDIQAAYDENAIFGISTRILRTSINNHKWYGALSTFNYELSKKWTLKGGIDLRTYKGEHKREVYDLLGGGYFNQGLDNNIDPATKLQVGDTYLYNNDGRVRWAGGFGLLEYSHEKWSAFINVSSAVTSYSKVDYHAGKWLVLADTTLTIGYSDVHVYNDVTYDRNTEGLTFQESPWKSFANYTFKGGAKYNISKAHSVFANLGYLSKAPRFNNVINRDDVGFIADAKNEVIQAFEIGYAFKSKKFAAKINAYHTEWINKPVNPSSLPSKLDENEERLTANINGIKARHQGIEIDAAYRVLNALTVEGLFSMGNWVWNSGGIVEFFRQDGSLFTRTTFDATGVHVGDAAQTQIGGLIRYEPIKGLYFKVKATHFSRYFSNFNPDDLSDDDHAQFDANEVPYPDIDYNRTAFEADGVTPWETYEKRESWKIPAYTLFDFHAGYTHRFKNQMKIGVRFNVLNVLNSHYISDANNNDTFNNGLGTRDFDAVSAGVHMGQGRRFNTSVQFTF